MKILVTGGTGMVGRHLRDIMPDAIYVGSKDCDLTNYEQTEAYIKQVKPNIVIHLAARVGGILDNIQRPAEYFDDNIIINFNIIKACRLNQVDRFIGVLSTCVYPDTVLKYPMEEVDLFSGPPAVTNFSYGYAKRCLAVQIDAYNKQYGTNYNYVIPCNLYSEYDNYNHQDKMHFVTSLLKKIKTTQTNKLELLGTGKPLRQYMYAGDLALILKLMVDSGVYDNFNVCTEENLSIDEMARTALEVTGKYLEITYTSTTDGQYRKDVSNKRLLTHFPSFKFTKFADGIKYVYNNIIVS